MEAGARGRVQAATALACAVRAGGHGGAACAAGAQHHPDHHSRCAVQGFRLDETWACSSRSLLVLKLQQLHTVKRVAAACLGVCRQASASWKHMRISFAPMHLAPDVEF